MKFVVPGVRLCGSDADDQKRICTPAQAMAWGADMIVVGRAIRDADNPLEAAQEILGSIS